MVLSTPPPLEQEYPDVAWNSLAPPSVRVYIVLEPDMELILDYLEEGFVQF